MTPFFEMYYFVLGIIILVYFVLLFCSIRAMYKNELKKYTQFKTMTSLGFLLIGLICFLITKEKLYFYFLPAYICCFLGDYFLAIAKTENGILKKNKFLLGLLCFAFAHVFFLIAFASLLDWHTGFLFVICAALGTSFFLYKSKTGSLILKDKYIPCLSYSALVNGFFGIAFTYAIRMNFSISSMILFIGSCFFMLSDSVLSFKYFGAKRRAWYIGVELTLYYIGMLLLSSFTLFM